MKVLHINTGQDGGAAWCARRINNALVQQGVESRMLFAEGTCLPDGVEGDIAHKDPSLWDKNFLLTKLRHLVNRIPWVCDADKFQFDLNLAQERSGTHLYLHQPCSHYKNIAHHPLVEWADIIHLHWVPDFVDYPTFFKDVRKPIVWTMHDMFPFIGAMHFESDYTIRPRGLDEIDSVFRNIKKKSISKAANLNVVAISEKMENLISSSDILRNCPVTLIHNGVDTNVFKPTFDEYSSIRCFIKSLKQGTKLFLFSSYGIWDRRKGLDRLLNAMTDVYTIGLKDIALVVVGSYCENDNLPKAAFPVFCTGLIQDQRELSNLYSAADYFINVSYEEAFAQTPLEAMACGTPVVSTPCSGASDLIRPFNGVICDGYDTGAIAKGIEKALDTEYDSDAIRRHIIEEYDYSKIAGEYIELYESVLRSSL